MTKIITAIFMVFSLCLFANANADTYPSAQVEPEGAWGTMGANPYIGMPHEGCMQMGYTSNQCDEYMRLRDAGIKSGKCKYMHIPEGTILNKLLFGGNVVQKNVKVINTETFVTTRSLVCELGGDALISFDGCSNLAVVEDWSFEKTPTRKFTSRKYQKPVQGCPLDNVRYQLVSVLEQAAIEHECSQRLVAVEGENGLDGERLSRTCGPMLNADYEPGVLNHGMELMFVPYEGGVAYLLFQGSVQSNRLTATEEFEDMVFDNMIRIPDSIEVDGETVYLEEGFFETRFGDYGKLHSPLPVHLSQRAEEFPRAHDPVFKKRCGRIAATAIERLEEVPEVTEDAPELPLAELAE